MLAQLFALNAFLGIEYNFYGISVIRSLFLGKEWIVSSRFPGVSMCDISIRRLGNVQKYTVQCVLSINLFNERIFLFIWYWLVFLATLTCVSLLTWFRHSILKKNRHCFIKKHLAVMGRLKSKEDELFATKFLEDYLRQDGILVLRLLEHNVDSITLTHFVCMLWDFKKEKSIHV